MAVAHFKTEAEVDDMNFPDKTDYGRFWIEWLQKARAALTASAPAVQRCSTCGFVGPRETFIPHDCYQTLRTASAPAEEPKA